ncbi:mitochondrial inner-membrane-bound regulator-domain-containing protein [Dipodascopsis uninucleata]
MLRIKRIAQLCCGLQDSLSWLRDRRPTWKERTTTAGRYWLESSHRAPKFIARSINSLTDKSEDNEGEIGVKDDGFQLPYSYSLREQNVIVLDRSRLSHSTKKRRPAIQTRTDEPLAKETLDFSATKLMEPHKENYMTVVEMFDSEMPKILQSRKNRLDELKVSEARYDQIAQLVSSAFLVEQLRRYAREMGERVSSSLKKRILIDVILKNLWGIAISSDIQKDVHIYKMIKFSERREAMLLMTSNWSLPRQWTSMGAAININPEKLTLEIKASEGLVSKITSIWERVLSNMVHETVDMTFLSKVPYGNIEHLPINMISSLSDTYIEIVDRTKLRISALASRKITVARRLIVYSLNLHTHESERILYSNLPRIQGNGTEFLKVYDDDSLPVIYRHTSWARWRTVKEKRATVHSLKTLLSGENDGQLARLRDEILSQPMMLIDPRAVENNVQESLQPPLSSQEVNDAVISIFDDIKKESSDTDVKPMSGYLISTASRDTSKSLMNISDIIENAHPVTANITDKMNATNSKFSVVFGLGLHEHARTTIDTDRSRDPVVKVLEQYIFTPNIPAFSKFITRCLSDELALLRDNKVRFVQSGISSMKDANMSNDHVSLDYTVERKYIVLHLVPSPYHDPRNFTQYPPVAIRLPVNDKWQIDKSMANIVSCESTTVVDVLLPSLSTDMRIKREEIGQISGSQDSFKDFVSKLNVDMSSQSVSVPATINLNIPQMDSEQKEIVYMFKSLEQRTDIHYYYGSHNLRYSIVEGGLLEGRRVEITLAPDDASTDAGTPEKLLELTSSAVELAICVSQPVES